MKKDRRHEYDIKPNNSNRQLIDEQYKLRCQQADLNRHKDLIISLDRKRTCTRGATNRASAREAIVK